MNKIGPLISIVAPVYGVEKYIGECVDSLFGQTYKNTEYIFVNDKTPDNSIDILNKKIADYSMFSNVQVIENRENAGLALTRANGISKASGDYIFLVDTDDKLPLNAIEILVNTAIETNADFVESDFAYYPDTTTIIKRRFNGSIDDHLSKYLKLEVPVSVWGKLYKRELFEDVFSMYGKGRDTVEDYVASSILLSRATKIANTNQVTYYYRTDNPNSYSNEKYIKWKRIENMIWANAKQHEVLKDSKSDTIKEALELAKLKIKDLYYLLVSPEDRAKLISLFPEANSFVNKLSRKERLCWWMMEHNNLIGYKLIKKFI